ncbi:N-acetylneuraminate synthase family protein [Virgibacillus ihumii]|uniref:N-acetylneuraminate synthase family protein n=1 Tax=Virgibacillus ihumii TaxID=2686091 RepID=UPI00157DC7C8|nr:N-acetylneuraminate synthase family protein [Virgibacillus ihumii]
MPNTKIIAEIANAHQGDPSILKKLVLEAAKAGADAIKFQWFKYNHLAIPDYKWYEAYRDLFIKESDWSSVISLAKKQGMHIWADIFDDWGMSLAKKYESDITGLKLPPSIIQSKLIIREIGKLEKPIILGVGGWYDTEIDEALAFIRTQTKQPIMLMYGFQGYPTQMEDVNLARLSHLKNKYNCKIGFADHEDGHKKSAVDIPVYARFLGADVIEKHITLNRSEKGHDYYSSLEPHEFKEMVDKIRSADIIYGDHTVNDTQRRYLNDALRVVARQDIPADELITLDKVSYKRADLTEGFMPNEFEKGLPFMANTGICKNEPLSEKNSKKPKIIIAVIARLKSTRLKRKALLPINGIPSVKRCLMNCLAATKADGVVLATSDLKEDLPLTEINMEGNVSVVKGDPDNVGQRMLKVAEITNADIILRVTGDNPAVSPEIIDYLINKHGQNGADLTLPNSNHAIGTGADVYDVNALKKLISIDPSLTYSEYLSLYFKNNPHLFKTDEIELPEIYRYPNWRLTMDETKDYELFERIYTEMNIKEEPLYFDKIRSHLINNPSITSINSGVQVKWGSETNTAIFKL